MKTIGNILWLVLSGFWMALGWLFYALVLALTFVGIPFALQCLKMAQFTLWPFGRKVVKSPTGSSLSWVGNLIWFIPGLFLALGYILTGLLLCATVVGIPFGIQSMKFATLALAPFGKEIVTDNEIKDALAAYRQAQA